LIGKGDKASKRGEERAESRDGRDVRGRMKHEESERCEEHESGWGCSEGVGRAGEIMKRVNGGTGVRKRI
jgi:hypothetical protein